MKSIFTFFILFISGSIAAQGNMDCTGGLSNKPQNTGIRISCRTSITSASPLYILDGDIVDSSFLKTFDPGQIESISILKGTEAAKYGSTGANGVIVITTKNKTIREFQVKDGVNAQPIPGAYLTFIPEEKPEDSLMLTANEKGKLSTNLLQDGMKYRVKISSVGYEKWEGTYLNKKRETIYFDLSRNIVTNEPVIVIVIRCFTRRPNCRYSILKVNSNADSSIINHTKIRMFPNPVIRGNSITLECETKSDKRLRSQILNLDGKVLSTQNLTAYKGQNRLTFSTDSRWSTGVYFIRIVDENGKPVRQEKFLIQ